MSRFIFQNCRDLFINHIRHRAISAITHRFIPIRKAAVGRTVGKIRLVQHGNVIIGIAYAHQNFSAQSDRKSVV